MDTKILEELEKEFAFIGDEQISGKTAMKIINNTIERFTIPKHIEDAQAFLQECGADMGFMGSPEYDKQKKIVDAYFEPIKKKVKEDLEKLEYLRLKSKYEDS
jgi:hypothetical protein